LLVVELSDCGSLVKVEPCHDALGNVGTNPVERFESTLLKLVCDAESEGGNDALQVAAKIAYLHEAVLGKVHPKEKHLRRISRAQSRAEATVPW
jgi:hypothetical protein